MKWETAYSVGIEEIDNQHKELLRLFSVVQDTVNADQGWSAIHFSILEVTDFARFHFRFEEALMRLYAFPDFENHCNAHLRILADADRLVGESLRDDASSEVANFLRNWLITHIQGSDRSYAQHILAGATVARSLTAG
jgi:hemerythrin